MSPDLHNHHVYNADYLASMSKYQFAEVSVSQFILQFGERVISTLIGSSTVRLADKSFLHRDELFSQLYIDALERLERTLAKGLDTAPDMRFAMLYGSLSSVANTVLRRRIPLMNQISNMDGSGQYIDVYSESGFASGDEVASHQHSDSCAALEAREIAENALIVTLERLRHHFTPRQFRLLTVLVEGGYSVKELSVLEGCSGTKLWWSIEQIRSKLFTLIPEELRGSDDVLSLMPKRLRDSQLEQMVTQMGFSKKDSQNLIFLLTQMPKPEQLSTFDLSIKKVSNLLKKARSTLCEVHPSFCSDNETHHIEGVITRYLNKHPEFDKILSSGSPKF